MTLLSNPLILKYFSCTSVCNVEKDHPSYKSCMALRILEAMDIEIKKGERYIYWTEERIGEHVSTTDMPLDKRLGIAMRLPDRFQKKEEWCPTRCGPECPCLCNKPPKDPVEEKIKDLHREYMCQLESGGGSYEVVEKMIRELVKLAREERA